MEAGTLAEGQQLSLISTALETLGGAADVPGAADPGLQQQVHRLRQRHALLAACSSIAAAWPGANAACADAARATAGSLQQVALAPGKASSGATSSAMLDSCLQQLLTAGCAAVAVLQVAATLLALQEEPEQPPSPWTMLLAQPAAAAAAHAAVAAAAESAVGAALQALAPATAAGIPADDEQQTQQQRLSPGDAVQNLFALLRSLHQQPAVVGTEQGADAERDATAAAAEAAAAEALGTLRLLVWQALQSKAATYDGSGGAAETEAHLQVGGRVLWHASDGVSHAAIACRQKGNACAIAHMLSQIPMLSFPPCIL